MRYQPQNGRRRLSRLARTLGFTYAWNYGDGTTNAANAVTGQATALSLIGTQIVGGPGGKALQFDGNADHAIPILGNPFATSTCTYLWVESGTDSSSNGQAVISSHYGGASASNEIGGFQLRITGSAIHVLRAQQNDVMSFGGRDNTGKVNACGISVAGDYGGRHAIYINGALAGAQGGGGFAYTHGTSAFGAGSDCPSSSIVYYALAFAPVVVPDDQLAYLTANPWAMWESVDDSYDLLAIPSPLNYTLSAVAATFGITGQSAALKAARRLTGTSGGLATTGGSARLLVARSLVAAASSSALTPIAAALKAARRLLVAPGAVSLGSADGALRVARRLPGSAGTFGMSGSAANLAAARRLTALPASFAIGGGAITFVYTSAPGVHGPTYTLTGGSGLFAMSTSSARLMMTRRLVAAAGAFSAIGAPAGILATRRLSTAAGGFAIVGSAVRLASTRRLPAAAGLFATSGASVGLKAARRVSTPGATFAVVGGPAVFKYTSQTGIAIDASTIPASRRVIFPGSSRTVVFGGGTRVVVFGGGTRVVVFDVPSIEQESTMANADKPYFKDGKWWVDKDPQEKSYYVADITKELTDRATTAVSVEVIVGGVTVAEGPEIQGNLVVVKLEGADETKDADNFWTARVTCANTEQFDRTTWLNLVDN